MHGGIQWLCNGLHSVIQWCTVVSNTTLQQLELPVDEAPAAPHIPPSVKKYSLPPFWPTLHQPTSNLPPATYHQHPLRELEPPLAYIYDPPFSTFPYSLVPPSYINNMRVRDDFSWHESHPIYYSDSPNTPLQLGMYHPHLRPVLGVYKLDWFD